MPDGIARWRVLYTGSRAVTDRAQVYRDLDTILAEHPALLIRHGACTTGGDRFAADWGMLRRSQAHDVVQDPRPAPFGKLGKIAGPMRNAFMAGLGADECLAHIHAHGTGGARGCADFAEWAGIPTRRIPAR